MPPPAASIEVLRADWAVVVVWNLRLSPNERICSEYHYIEARKALYDAIYMIGARIKNVMLGTPTQKSPHSKEREPCAKDRTNGIPFRTK